ncbi:MAG TPA: ATP-dependent DNA helicase RecG, partial [Gemmatimonadales bacterium]|nr:ATP-dependent DNA helicase RecG [Gemmatimonadales bacterium]
MAGRSAAAPLRLDTPVQFLKGIGERRAEALSRLDIRTARDLLWHLPHRYIDASTLTPLARAEVGSDVACVGRVVAKGVLPTRRGLRIFHAVLRDESGLLECVWPGQPFLDRTIAVGQTMLVSGPVRFYHGRQMAPREFVILADGENERDPLIEGKVLPVYPATEGLSHKVIRSLIERHLDGLIALSSDALPETIRHSLDLPSLSDALRSVHRPVSVSEAERGRRRLAFDELLDLQLMLIRARSVAKRHRTGVAFSLRRDLTTRLRETLPWELTSDQQRALREIVADMTAPDRMHRLLMGDVGTGKTVVALFAMLLAIENEFQAALMAPTELLVEQHAATLNQLLEPLHLRADMLLGRQTAGEKAAVRRRLAGGQTRLVVGTHALLQEGVGFHRLGLVVIDEQHRFGVEQRAALIGKGAAPDVLLLTATPIPRSLALTLYGDLDISTLRERPPARGSVRTAVRSSRQRERVLDFIESECSKGRQAYVVLPVIEESERADLRAASTMHQTLAARWPELRVGLVHGRLKAEERDKVMRQFRQGELNVLVATTVIEVGIDVPNASIMVIEHPDRFGLAQLHQLRGRIGRGGEESYCILLVDGPSPDRLHSFAATQDGFKIAQLDLEERGMGDLIGARQSGGFEGRHARLPEDADLLARARDLASTIIAGDPAMMVLARSRARARRSASSGRRACRTSKPPDCRAPIRSPIPRSSRSSSAILKP